jgi:alpha-ketoglutarate-dependent taurine dioxygenase
MKNNFNKSGAARWHVVTDNAFTQGSSEHAAPELARQIENRIHEENLSAEARVVKIEPNQGLVVVECNDDFGMSLNDLPAARYAEKAQPKAKAPKPR